MVFDVSVLTLFPGLGDDISSTLAHHLGDVKRTVGLIGYRHGPVHCLRLHLGGGGRER